MHSLDCSHASGRQKVGRVPKRLRKRASTRAWAQANRSPSDEEVNLASGRDWRVPQESPSVRQANYRKGKPATEVAG